MLTTRKALQGTGIAFLYMMVGAAGCTTIDDASLAADDSIEASGGVALETAGGIGASAVDAQHHDYDDDDLVERGQYLAIGIGSCHLCHTSYNPDGSLDTTRLLAGNPCLVDVVPDDDTQGCLATPNLTNHDTGLARFSDEQIKNMITKGIKPSGRALHPFMPYWAFANMSSDDTDAVIAFLRTVPGIDQNIPKGQAPWLTPPAASRPIDMNQVPKPSRHYYYQSAAWRGRYLAANTGACIECHTPENHPYPDFPAGETPTPEEIAAWANYDAAVLDRSFQGGRFFAPTIISRNLTPDYATGLGSWSFGEILDTVRTGVTPDGQPLCPPMRGFTDMDFWDALDIVHYLRSIQPGSFEVPASDCGLTPEDAPAEDGGRCWPRGNN